jgi:hypothetical protein
MPDVEHEITDLTGDSDDEANVLAGITLPEFGDVPPSAGIPMNGLLMGDGDGADMEMGNDFGALPTLDAPTTNGEKQKAGQSSRSTANGHESLVAPDEDFEITGSSGPGPSAIPPSPAPTSPRTASVMHSAQGQGWMHPAIMSMYGHGGMGGGIAAPATPGPNGQAYGMYRQPMTAFPDGRQVHPPPLFAHHPAQGPMFPGYMPGMHPNPFPGFTIHPPNTDHGIGGSSASDAIDITRMRIPSPPPTDPKQTICLGGIQSAVNIFDTPSCVYVGGQPPEGSRERYEVITYREAEFLKVKLKVS